MPHTDHTKLAAYLKPGTILSHEDSADALDILKDIVSERDNHRDAVGGPKESQIHGPAYQFSTDYEELFRMICDGHTAVGFVDYRFDRGNPDEAPMRDVVQIIRHGEGQIMVGARGISYGSIYPFECEGRVEQEVFVQRCRAINLGWIPARAPWN